MIRYPKGASDLPLEVILSITNDPESEDITKKIDTMKILTKLVIEAIGYSCKKKQTMTLKNYYKFQKV